MVGRCSEGDRPQTLEEASTLPTKYMRLDVCSHQGGGRYKCGVVPSTCVLHGNLTETNMCYTVLNFSISSPLSPSLSFFSIPSHIYHTLHANTVTNTSTPIYLYLHSIAGSDIGESPAGLFT